MKYISSRPTDFEAPTESLGAIERMVEGARDYTERLAHEQEAVRQAEIKAEFHRVNPESIPAPELIITPMQVVGFVADTIRLKPRS